MIAALNITAVVMGTKMEVASVEEMEVYSVAKEMGILVTIESGSDFSMGKLLSRIHTNHVRLEKKVKKKMIAEQDHYKEKHGLEEYVTTQ
jgi:hypothetical protein|tara:strand:- start:155 stop:424 length:270 start_codon:yes stop_codon:yes gene_type:complete